MCMMKQREERVLFASSSDLLAIIEITSAFGDASKFFVNLSVQLSSYRALRCRRNPTTRAEGARFAVRDLFRI